MENIEETPFRITHTVQALGSTLRGESENVSDANGLGSGDRISSEPEKLWFKESSAKNLRNRDFLSPSTVLNTLYADGQVLPAVMVRVQSLRGTGVLPVAGGELMGEGLRVRVDRTAVFQKVLSDASVYLKPPCQRQRCVMLNCPARHPKPNLPSPDTFTLGQLRTVLLTDHLGALLRRRCPSAGPMTRGRRTFWRLYRIPLTEKERRQMEEDERVKERIWMEIEEMLRVNLKRVFQEEQLPGYDLSLGTCTGGLQSSCRNISRMINGNRMHLSSMLSLIAKGLNVISAKGQCVSSGPTGQGYCYCTRHLVCGPMKTPGTHLSAAQYLQLRRVQMEASEIKYGEQVEDQTWDDIIKVMTSATVRFELLSTVHTSPVTLDVQREGSVSTKGLRGGVFVMYNCARLHTLFDSYERGVGKGLYPEIPEGSQLDFSALKEEVITWTGHRRLLRGGQLTKMAGTERMEWRQTPGNHGSYVFDVFYTIPLIPLQSLPQARSIQLRCHKPVGWRRT
ncbi:DALR anticodon-binding domain-containing protein 3-like isoform X2 [Salvelinus fontinalis]|uniref:DALR anticodon-binding domain-containing protein 3-like isoform X2 n=1 Tax=Salvelinus fontinalis TaxID=8038 RepID=UPI00248609B4|nr:DALR anticodon-binding domain-containing protein 3-like isoform X2 [Salvelinus fontinalis]XP_055787936.1 DALR anticodon-binding domain-containing protein 3-like isoform X2 [Salvelinus fontinalis]